MWETQVQSLDQEDSLEKGMATHSSILAWRIPWTEEPGRLQEKRKLYPIFFMNINAKSLNKILPTEFNTTHF